MNCPYCGATYTAIACTDPTASIKVSRRRRCVECDCVFTTVEVYAEVYERLEMQAANFKALISPESRAEARREVNEVLARHGRQRD